VTTVAEPVTLAHELRTILEAAMTNHPRTLQTRIGPSELGNPCDRCLAHKLGGTPDRPEAAWLPQIGTAVHEWAEMVILRHEFTRAALGMPPRFLPEHKVTVGQIRGQDITGHSDVFDTHTGTVIDWKVVGTTTLRQAKAHGPSLGYSRQAQLYGKGWEDAGHQVTTVCIYYLPRNSVSLSDGYAWTAPYDRHDAERTLARANALAARIHIQGLLPVLDTLPPHTGQEFTCKRAPDYRAPTTNPSDPFGP
jgi:hypothetical protein